MTSSDGTGRVVERVTITCAHCNRLYWQPKKGEPYGFCLKCNQPTCTGAKCNATCVPYEKKIDDYAARMRFRASL